MLCFSAFTVSIVNCILYQYNRYNCSSESILNCIFVGKRKLFLFYNGNYTIVYVHTYIASSSTHYPKITWQFCTLKKKKATAQSLINLTFCLPCYFPCCSRH